MTKGQTTPHVNEAFLFVDHAAPPTELAPGARATSDIRLGFSEVCIRFRSQDRAILRALYRHLQKAPFKGLDFEGNQRDYEIQMSYAYNDLQVKENATKLSTVTLYLPQARQSPPAGHNRE